MSQQIVAAKALMTAWSTKDETLMREHLHENFYFKGPLMEMHSVDECVASMADCPFSSHIENSEHIEQGNTVVNIFQWVVTEPFSATVPAVEVLQFEDNKVKHSRLFFDTALFPEGSADSM